MRADLGLLYSPVHKKTWSPFRMNPCKDSEELELSIIKKELQKYLYLENQVDYVVLTGELQ